MLKAILLAAIEIFKAYLHKDEVHVTSDGQGFFEKHFAEAHAPNLADKTVTTVTRRDVEKHIADGVLEAAKQVLTNDTQPAQNSDITPAAPVAPVTGDLVPAPAKLKVPKVPTVAKPATKGKAAAKPTKKAEAKPAVQAPKADAPAVDTVPTEPAAEGTPTEPAAEVQA